MKTTEDLVRLFVTSYVYDNNPPRAEYTLTYNIDNNALQIQLYYNNGAKSDIIVDLLEYWTFLYNNLFNYEKESN